MKTIGEKEGIVTAQLDTSTEDKSRYHEPQAQEPLTEGECKQKS